MSLYEFTDVPVAEVLEKQSKLKVLVRVVVDEKSHGRLLLIMDWPVRVFRSQSINIKVLCIMNL